MARGRRKIEGLSKREKDVLVLVAQGLRVREIAKKLCLSKHTVVSHKKNICFKLDVKNSPQAVAEGFRRGILD